MQESHINTTTTEEIANKGRMKELVGLLNKASESYYAKDEEIMSNYEYDKLYDELVALEAETGIVLANSPTVNVGFESVDELPKERHAQPMLSLSKTKDREELKSWLQNQEGLLSWKLDGLTIVLTYQDGTLQKAVTRGNGEVGEVITNNAKVFKNVPLKIAFQGELIVRGEAIITYSDFNKINDSIQDADAKYKNKNEMDTLYLLQFACFLFMLVNILILGITRLHMKWMNRRYEVSRWLVIKSMY